jgi:RimJ/RimL family protein N-acetyltransferase
MVGADASQATARISDAEAEDWYRNLLDDPHAWIIEGGGRAVGTIRLHHVRETDRSARLAIGIFDPAWRGKGLGTEATRLLLGYAFGELGLHRVELRVLEYNAAGRRAYAKAGFTEEGLERDSAFIGGRFLSDVRMSILEDEYRGHRRDQPR